MGMWDWLTQPTPTNMTQTTTPTYSAEQKAFWDQISPYFKNYANNPWQSFGKSSYAGTNSNQTGGEADIINAGVSGGQVGRDSADAWRRFGAGAFADPSTGMATDILNNPMGRIAGLGYKPGDNPYLNNVAGGMRDASNRNLTEQQLPAIAAGAQQAGGMYSGGSTRQGIAEGLATGRTNAALDQSISDMFLKDFQNTQQINLAERGQDVGQRGQDMQQQEGLLRLLSSNYGRGQQNLADQIRLGSDVQSQSIFEGLTKSMVGDKQQARNQAELDAAIRDFYTNQAGPGMWLQQLMSMYQSMPGGGSTSTSTGQQGQPSWLQMLAGMFGTGAGAYLGTRNR